MPLFGGDRDAAFVKTVNREIMQRILATEVAIYKHALTETQENIYGETNKKMYYAPIRVHAYIKQDDVRVETNDFGYVDTKKSIRFGFLRDDFVELSLVLEPSDIIKYDEAFYEVDNVINNQYWYNRSPESLIGQNLSEYAGFGYSVSLVAETHLTVPSNLNIVEVRSGVNTEVVNIPRNL